ncbi:MAG: 5'-nucleotidase C-terminal domain-containing protein [Sandaracinaceae bacterium]
MALCALTATTPARAQIRTIARVIATGNVGGRLAHPVCDDRTDLEPDDAAAFSYAITRVQSEPDAPLIVDTGGLLAPHGVARFSAKWHPRALAEMVQQMGYRALAVGQNDLAMPRVGLVNVARALRDRGIPMVASNLRCRASTRALCDELVDASDGVSTHRVNGRLTAFISVLRPSVLRSIAPDLAEGLVLEPPRETVERFTRMAHERGAELVIAVIDGQVEGGPIQLASELDPTARPNLLLVSDYDELLFARPRSLQPVLVGTLQNDAVEIRIRESSEIHDGYEMLAQPLEGRGISVGEPVLDWMDTIGRDYCARWGHPLAGARLERELDVPGMVDMVAEIMRAETGADVAIINRQALDQRWRPAQAGSLTASDVYIALEYDEPLEVASVDQAWLTALARQAASTGELVTPGLTYSGDASAPSVEIGGHAAQARQSYRVVTLRFLARGGDHDLVPPLPGRREWTTLEGEEGTLRSVVLDYLDRRRDEDPRETLPDADETLEWTFGAGIDLGFSGSTVDNPQRRCTAEELAMVPQPCDGSGFFVDENGARVPIFQTTQLLLGEVVSFSVAAQFTANAEAPDWTLENDATFRYRTTWASATHQWVESEDQIRSRNALSWRGLRDPDANQWYLPDPTVSLFIESEFTEPTTRDWHWFLFRPMAGGRFQLLDKLELTFNVGMQVQLLETPSLDPGAGVGATLKLQPWDFLALDGRYARLGFTFDYFLSDLGDQNQGVLRGQLDAAFDLAGPLAMTTSFSLLLQHDGIREFGFALNASLGLRLSTVARAVGP